MNDAITILRELVALKRLHDAIEAAEARGTDNFVNGIALPFARDDYERRKADAWAAAFALIDTGARGAIALSYHQAHAVAERAERLRKLAKKHRGYGYTGTERIVLTFDSPYNHPEARGGLFLQIEGHGIAPVPLFAKDLGHERDFAIERLGMRDEDGHIQHPDMDGIGFDEFDMGPQLRALGWESTTVCFESDATHEMQESYSDAGSPDCSYWTPSRPGGEGWLMAAIYDTEDGPVALYVRRAADAGAVETEHREVAA